MLRQISSHNPPRFKNMIMSAGRGIWRFSIRAIGREKSWIPVPLAWGWRRERSATSNGLRFVDNRTENETRVGNRVPTGRKSGRSLWCQGAPTRTCCGATQGVKLRGHPRGLHDDVAVTIAGVVAYAEKAGRRGSEPRAVVVEGISGWSPQTGTYIGRG